jgi:hypothetical protein
MAPSEGRQAGRRQATPLAGLERERLAENEALSAQSNKIKDTEAEFQRDATEYLTAQAQLNTTVKANYPRQDWSFLNPNGQQ